MNALPGGILLEGGNVGVENLVPMRQQLVSLFFQAIEKRILRLRGSRIRRAVYRQGQECQLAVEPRRVAQRVFVRADPQVDQRIAYRNELRVESAGSLQHALVGVSRREPLLEPVQLLADI